MITIMIDDTIKTNLFSSLMSMAFCLAIFSDVQAAITLAIVVRTPYIKNNVFIFSCFLVSNPTKNQHILLLTLGRFLVYSCILSCLNNSCVSLSSLLTVSYNKLFSFLRLSGFVVSAIISLISYKSV